MYGRIANIVLGVLLCCSLFNCGRFGRRIVEVHKIDTVLVNPGRVVDTVFVFTKTRDTLRTEHLTIYRDSDRFRYFFRERSCTTRINRTVIQPERVRTLTPERRPGTLDKIAGALTALALALALLIILTRNKR